jgi:hypothetical protein
MPLEKVKAIGHETGTTVNDVLLAAVAGALGRYLGARGGEVAELTAMVPFNLRPLDQPLPPDLGNRFGLVFLRLPVGIKDRRRRLDSARMERSALPEVRSLPGARRDRRDAVQIEKLLVDLITETAR